MEIDNRVTVHSGIAPGYRLNLGLAYSRCTSEYLDVYPVPCLQEDISVSYI